MSGIDLYIEKYIDENGKASYQAHYDTRTAIDKTRSFQKAVEEIFSWIEYDSYLDCSDKLPQFTKKMRVKELKEICDNWGIELYTHKYQPPPPAPPPQLTAWQKIMQVFKS